MLGLDDLEIGCLVWAGDSFRANLREAKKRGIRAGQIGFSGDLPLEGLTKTLDPMLTAEQFIATAALLRFPGEDYTSIVAIQRTVGLAPRPTRKDRMDTVKRVSALARELAIDTVTCSLGIFPPEREDPVYEEVRDFTLELCRFCRRNGQSFAVESGSEPPKVLLRLIEDVHHPNLKVNFNPGSMIRYGTGDPVEALDVFGKYVTAVTCNDANWPSIEHPESLGEKRPIGHGNVNWTELMAKLKALGYRGALNIEDTAGRHTEEAVGISEKADAEPVRCCRSLLVRAV